MEKKSTLIGILLFPTLSLHATDIVPSLEITPRISGFANIFQESQPVVYGVLAKMLSSVCSDLISNLCPNSPSLQLFIATSGTDFTNRVIRFLRENPSTLQACSDCSAPEESETNDEDTSSIEDTASFIEDTLETTLQKSFSYGKQLAVPSLLYGAGVTVFYKLLSCLSSEKLAYFTAAFASSIAQFALDSDFYTNSIKNELEPRV